MWFPELFSRVEKYGGSPCDHPPASNTSSNETEICQPIPENWVFFEGFMTAVSNLPGNILTIFLMDKIGRKPLLGKIFVDLFEILLHLKWPKTCDFIFTVPHIGQNM